MSGCPYSQKTLPAFGSNSVATLTASFAKIFMRDTTEIIHTLTRLAEGSDRTHVNLFGVREFHVLTHPDDIKTIFLEKAASCPVTHAKSSAASYVEGTKLGNSSSTPDVWKHYRLGMAHHFSAHGLKNNFDSAMTAAMDVLESWKDNQKIIVDRETTKIAVKYAWAAFFSAELSDTDANTVADVGSDDIQKYFLMSFATLGKVPAPIVRKLTNVENFTGLMDKLLSPVIDKRLAQSTEEWPDDYLTEILVHTGLDRQPMTPEARTQVMCNLTEILVASYLNTRTTLYWALHELAKKPDLQTRIKNETLNGSKETVTAVVNETLRLYPPIYLLPREAAEDVTLKGDYHIKAGSHIIIPIWNLHRDSRWFPDSENFNPDVNFSPAANNNRPTNAYLPFGLGRHKCPGFGSALQEVTAVLGAICTKYEINPDPNGKQPYLRASTLINPERESTLTMKARPSAANIFLPSIELQN